MKGETRVLEKVGEGDYERNQRRSSGGGRMLKQLNAAARMKK